MKKREPFSFEFIRLDRMPGFPPNAPFGVEGLRPGVNVVTGPNMSGKTTLANAMSAVLWPGLADGKAEVSAVINHAGSAWALRMEEKALQSCQRDGRASRPPELPSAEVRGRYHVSLVDLLQSRTGADELAQQIARETAGGYDLAKAATEAGAGNDAGPHRREVAALEQARMEVRDQRSRQEQLARQEEELAGLEEKRENAARARHDVARLEAAKELRTAMREETEARTVLQTFPASMAKLAGTEKESLAAIKDKLDREREGLNRCLLQGRMATEAATETGLPEGGVPAELVHSVRNRLLELGEQEERLAQRSEERTRAAARVRTTLEALGLTPGLDSPKLDNKTLVELERFAARAERHAGRTLALKSQAALLGRATSDAGDDVDRLVLGRNDLVGWLRTPVEGAVGKPASRSPLLVIATLMALASVLLAFLVHWGFLALLAAGVVAFVVAWRSGSIGPPSDGQAHFEREFLAKGLGEPGTWTVDSVGQLLVQLGEREAAARLARDQQAELTRVRAQMAEAELELKSLVDERTRLLAQHGAAPPVDPEPGEAVFASFARLTTEWHLARTAEEEAAAAAAETMGKAQALLKELAGALVGFGYEPGRSAADVRGMLEDLVERRSRQEKALADKRAAEDASQGHRERIAGLEGEVTVLYVRLGLEEGDEAALMELMRQLGHYAESQNRLRTAQVNRQGATQRLAERGGDPELSALGDEVLERRLEEALTLEASWEDAVQQITRIRRDLEAAGGGTALTDALAAQQEAAEELRRCLDRDLDRVAAGLLVEYLKEQVRSCSRPPVFRRAAELLADITAGKCRLEMEDTEPARFTVVETGDARARELRELSSGTRLQLLLAVRLAYIELQEQGAALPLLLDETLANSDEERALAIVAATSALAAKGRQIFYFTAQHDEVAKWKAMSAQLGQAPPHVVDLAEVRKLQLARKIPLPDAAKLPPAPPAPLNGESHLEYGRRLHVAGIDPSSESVDGVHVWHLLDDPEAVHALLLLRCPTWGQMRVLCEHRSGGGELVAPSQLARMKAGALAIELAAEHWRTGRGRPVTRSVLRASGAISDGFIEAVVELAQSCGGDAGSLIAGLQSRKVSGFRTDKLNRLKEYLEQEGFLDARPSIPEAEALPWVMAALADRMAAGTITADSVARLVASVYRFREGGDGHDGVMSAKAGSTEEANETEQ